MPIDASVPEQSSAKSSAPTQAVRSNLSHVPHERCVATSPQSTECSRCEERLEVARRRPRPLRGRVCAARPVSWLSPHKIWVFRSRYTLHGRFHCPRSTIFEVRHIDKTTTAQHEKPLSREPASRGVSNKTNTCDIFEEDKIEDWLAGWQNSGIESEEAGGNFNFSAQICVIENCYFVNCNFQISQTVLLYTRTFRTFREKDPTTGLIKRRRYVKTVVFCPFRSDHPSYQRVRKFSSHDLTGTRHSPCHTHPGERLLLSSG